MTISVFLADDHAMVREGLERILDAEGGIEVVGQAKDGQSAIDGVARLRPDVAILDIKMPGLSGLAAARRIREACPETQIVILSMHDGSEYVQHALRAGARGYVLKACASAELIEAVRTVHAGHTYTSQAVSDQVIEGLQEPQDGEASEDPLASLSDREREVFHLVIEGKTSREIGEMLSLSPKTIETHRGRLYKKLDVQCLAELMRFAARHKLISLE